MTEALNLIKNYQGPHITIMEVCGTHTHEIFKLGLRSLLPPSITLISGPGCPVCVTETAYIDRAIFLAQKNVIVCTFGDLLRVPGTNQSLIHARSQGCDIRMVYSPLDAVQIARQEKREVVFLSVGFETTAPAECLALKKAEKEHLTNFSLLVANKTMPAAYATLRDAADCFLYPGHVCAITGTKTCEDLIKQGVSGVVAGFTAEELITALATILVSYADKPFFKNCYPSVVRPEGLPQAQALINTYFEPCDSEWRGIGNLKNSGLKLKNRYANFDSQIRFDIPDLHSKSNPGCRCGEVLKGAILPKQCKLFGRSCTPEHPVGACMVSSEGTCAAHYQYNN